tara:strand:- start:3387 stop:4220 length:834 start_codon:yes stop_codon:yes gene_type:complete
MSRLDYIRDISLNELSIERIKTALTTRIKDVPHKLAWFLNTKAAKKNKKKLKSFHNIHKGKRGFIVANGPSLKNTDLSLLKNEITIGMNRIYLAANENNFMPDYLVVHDIPIQLLQFRKDLDELEITKFFNWNVRDKFTDRPNLTFIRSDYSPHFSKDLTKSSWGGHSVTNICIQLAYYMGFEKVYLVGKDHSYEETGTPGKLVSATGEEKNHFTKGYYKKGMGWRIPDYKGEELAYRLARKAFQEEGRELLDATIDGNLDIFPKVSYKSLFENTNI